MIHFHIEVIHAVTLEKIKEFENI